MEKKTINFTLNGENIQIEIPAHITLLKVLREHLHLTGTKEGCGLGECGNCVVLVDQKPVNSCICLGVDVNGKEVITIEGVHKDLELHPIQEAFIEAGGFQCGFCTPSKILIAKALLSKNPDPTKDEIKQAIAGSLCRCTGYAKIIDAILLASRKMKNYKKEAAEGS